MVARVNPVIVLVLSLILVALPSSAAMGLQAAALVESHTAHCDEGSYEYQLYSPPAHSPSPALLLLHGAGGRSADMLEAWLSLGKDKGIVLIAPQLPRTVAFEAIAPAVFRCIVADAERSASIDSHRMYLFGYSMGGYLAYDGAMFDSDLFAAVAVYAAAIDEEYYGIVDQASRKVPIAIYIGDHDQFYPLAQVRRTRDLLKRNGFPVRYREYTGQDHAFAPIAGSLEPDAWKYLSRAKLTDTTGTH
ncbi:MAG: dienelactone hydrolase family protein [Gemmatimonadota bacterium]